MHYLSSKNEEFANINFSDLDFDNFSPKPPQRFDSHMQYVLACGIKGESLSANQKLLQVFHLQTFTIDV